MALFRKKPPEDTDGTEKVDENPDAFVPQPEKARQWFDHARTGADSFNYDYALTCYATGIKLDPGLMSAHESMYEAALQYMNRGNKPASSKELKSFEDGTPVGRFAAAEFAWMKDLKNHKAALKTLDAAVKADQLEYGRSIAARVLNLIRAQKKFAKGQLIQAMQLFRAVEAWDESMMVGEMARQLDPSDNDLASELKNLSAQCAMDQGGYSDHIGQEGGFRGSIRDMEKQKQLLEEESITAGSTVEERNLARAKAAYEESPEVPDNINRYAQLIKRLNTPEAEEEAHRIFIEGFERSGEYRFRMAAGDIRIEQLERRIRKLDGQLESKAGDETLMAERAEVNEALLELKNTEYTERIERYPTDRARKYDLGTVQYELGLYEDAMPHFQKAKDEPKFRVRAAHMLGRCFLAADWYEEAISEFEESLQVIDATERDRELMIKYDLMLAMIEFARVESSIDHAKQAKTICSEIARADITYRDIRNKRREVDEVIKSLSGS